MLGAQQHVGLVGVLAHREDGLVLAQEEVAAGGAALMLEGELLLEELLLQLPGLGVGDTAKVAVVEGLLEGRQRRLSNLSVHNAEALPVVGGADVRG